MVGGANLLIAFGFASGAIAALTFQALSEELEISGGWAELIGSALGVWGAFVVAWWQFNSSERARKRREKEEIANWALLYINHLELLCRSLIFLYRYNRGAADERGKASTLIPAYRHTLGEIKKIGEIQSPPLLLGPMLISQWNSLVAALKSMSRGLPDKDDLPHPVKQQAIAAQIQQFHPGIQIGLKSVTSMMGALYEIAQANNPSISITFVDPDDGLDPE